jgi:hypothetical protein
MSIRVAYVAKQLQVILFLVQLREAGGCRAAEEAKKQCLWGWSVGPITYKKTLGCETKHEVGHDWVEQMCQAA